MLRYTFTSKYNADPSLPMCICICIAYLWRLPRKQFCNPELLLYMLHACRHKWNLHVICAKLKLTPLVSAFVWNVGTTLARVIIYVCCTDADRNPHHLCLVMCHMPPGYKPLTSQPHGNSQSNKPYFATWPSMLTNYTRDTPQGACACMSLSVRYALRRSRYYSRAIAGPIIP